jgi:hypothetical protein
MPLKVEVTIPKYILDRYRPGPLDDGESHRIVIPLWPHLEADNKDGGTLGIPIFFEVHLYQCPAGHRFRYWYALREDRTEKIECAECNEKAQGLTIKYRWKREGSVDFCRGCGAGWNRLTQSANHKDDCPYEIIKSKE